MYQGTNVIMVRMEVDCDMYASRFPFSRLATRSVNSMLKPTAQMVCAQVNHPSPIEGHRMQPLSPAMHGTMIGTSSSLSSTCIAQ